jgi:hypothetical protein
MLGTEQCFSVALRVSAEFRIDFFANVCKRTKLSVATVPENRLPEVSR